MVIQDSTAPRKKGSLWRLIADKIEVEKNRLLRPGMKLHDQDEYNENACSFHDCSRLRVCSCFLYSIERRAMVIAHQSVVAVNSSPALEIGPASVGVKVFL